MRFLLAGARRRTHLFAVAVVTGTVLLLAPAAATADTALSQNFESGIGTWTTSGFWHVQTNPQTVSVKNPQINPALVTLPDAGQLPSAFGGNNVAWFGEASTGTFCGPNYTSTSQSPKGGCTSSQAYSGSLTSPAFSLAGAQSAILRFRSWWEIEGVNADDFDEMQVQYSTNGTTWVDAGELNPIDNPAADHDKPYSNTGLNSTPAWKEYLVDLSAAINQPSVQIRFLFDTNDSFYNGFRGWLVDDVTVSTPFDAPAPTIASVKTCSGLTATQVWTVTGSNFVQKSKVLVDGVEIPNASISASDRIELAAKNAGNHTLQVKSPNGATATKTFASGNCADDGTIGASGAERRPTKTQVMCTYVVIEAADTCTATVGDATGGGKIPTGKVTFTSGNGGAFTTGNSCTLVKANYSTVSSCAVKFIPPQNKALAVTGTYAGNTELEPSAGSTALLGGFGTNAFAPTIPTWDNSGIVVTVENPVGGSTIGGSASVGGGGKGAGAVCSSGLGSGASSTRALPIAGTSAKKKKPKGNGVFKKDSKRTFKRKKRTVVVGKATTVSKAKKGKVKLKIRFNKRKLAKLLGNKRTVSTVLKVTIKVPGKAQPLVRYKVLKLKRKGALPKVGTKKRKKAKRSAAAERIVVDSSAPADNLADAAAQARGADWSGFDKCGTLVVRGRNGGNGVIDLTSFQWNGMMQCLTQQGEFFEAPGNVGAVAAPVSANTSQAQFSFVGQSGYYQYGLQGVLTNTGGSVQGGISQQVVNGNCNVQTNLVLGPPQLIP